MAEPFLRHALRLPALMALLAAAVALGQQEAESKPEPLQPEDPVLQLTVVFHLGGSESWTTQQSLLPVITEMQRIYDAARIRFDPKFTQDDAPTDDLDVYFVPKIDDTQRSLNGISHAGQPKEVFVRDNVSLRHVKDQRPTEPIAVPAYWPPEEPGQKTAVNHQQAEQARTTTHEIGHQLGLPHRQDTTNLMASGTTGWTLNDAEIQTMRREAVRRFKAKAVPPPVQP